MTCFLRYIDFDAHEIGVELRRLRSAKDLRAVRDFMETAEALRFSRFIIHPAVGATGIAGKRLETLSKVDSVTIVERVFVDRDLASTPEFRFQSAVDHPEAGRDGHTPGYRYNLVFDTNSETLVRYVCCVRLIAAAHSLKANHELDLRFATYELLTNTLQHGVFCHDSPSVRLSIAVTSESIGVVYKDNAEPFDTDVERDLDVGVLIKNKTKRGLGLWLIQKLANEFTFDREGQWNVTRLRLVCE
ncbi:MAG: ATP-binding protein [Candidatus Krumholzibacteria bacterium]|nr:ATP-binding protein [Candidatus Krumholzibacteria bacterium]